MYTDSVTEHPKCPCVELMKTVCFICWFNRTESHTLICFNIIVVSISSSFGHHQAKEFGVNKGYVGCTAEKESSVKKGFCKTRLSVCKVGACFLIICESVIAYVANLTEVNDVVYSPILLYTTLLINVGQTVQIKQCGEGHSSMCFFWLVLFQIYIL